MFSRTFNRSSGFEVLKSASHVDADCPHLISDDHKSNWFPIQPDEEADETNKCEPMKWIRLIVITLMTILIIYFFAQFVIWSIYGG